MNHHSNNSNALLVEIMIAVLFFSLCCTVLLRTFVSAHTQSELCGIRNEAMIEARDVAEQLNASQEPQELLASLSFENNGTEWSRSFETERFNLTVTLSEENTTVGSMIRAEITAWSLLTNQTDALFSLQAVHYDPLEVTE